MGVNRREFIKSTACLQLALADTGLSKVLSADQKKKARVIFGGDTLLGGYYNSFYGTMTDLPDKIDRLKSETGLSAVADHFLGNLLHLFRESALSVANLEGPITERYSVSDIERRMVSKKVPLRQHEDTADILQIAGIDMVTLANNHMYDFNREDGLKSTVDMLDKKVQYVGAGLMEDAYRCQVIPVNGIYIAFMGITDVIEPEGMAAAKNRLGVAAITETSDYRNSSMLNYALENIEEARKYSDFSVVLLHAGPARGRELNARQIEIADILV
ncbi:hypothetical protein GF345_04205, partial [Candidatus Woesearchaeota archaeon]|nr:hypothetical protein [Candidatus Woesearchaeota archaeon]